MRLALIADTFPPLRTSGAVQIRDLAREFVRQGHRLTVMLPSPGLAREWSLEDLDGVQVLRLRSPNTKDVGYVRRTFRECVIPGGHPKCPTYGHPNCSTLAAVI